MIKRDWEIVRIFLILAILTMVFVWGVQSLILTPTGSTSTQLPAVKQHTEANLGKLGIIATPPAAAPLREPSSSQKH